jgi:hypothetical protein
MNFPGSAFIRSEAFLQVRAEFRRCATRVALLASILLLTGCGGGGGGGGGGGFPDQAPLSSFGEDGAGELYIVTIGGGLYRIVQ